MVLSMTGFGSATQSFESRRGLLEITAEIRTVNSKFVDVAVRSPRAWVIFDSPIQKWVREKLKRGRVDINLSYRVVRGIDHEIRVNMDQVQALHDALRRVQDRLSLNANPITMADLLKLPDWIDTDQTEIQKDEEWPLVKSTLAEAMKSVLSERAKEGKSLQEAVRFQRQRFEEYFKTVRGQHDLLLKNLRERTKERIQKLYASDGFDPTRLEQEVVLWVARADFQEEVDRIEHHLKTFDRLEKEEGEIGRKFEFLIQELQREVNTLGSKCSDAAITPIVIEMKTCIERIREQIQNIE